MKKNVLTMPKDKLLNLAVGAGIPLGTAASGAAGGGTGLCGSCGGTCLGRFALAAWPRGIAQSQRPRQRLPLA